MTGIEAQIRTELDRLLLEYDAADQLAGEARREADRREATASDLAGQAQRLRLSLYALLGEKGSYGDANSDNFKRQMELRRKTDD